jgi:integrase
MSKHLVYPINWLNLNPNQIIAYLEYKEYREYGNIRGKHQVRNEWKTVKTFAKAYGLNAETWGYIPPNPPSPKVRIIPLPLQVHTIVHHQYLTDKYTNALYQYILMHGFLLGFRPSELVIQKVHDVHIEEGYMIITETKKRNQERQVFPEKQLLSGHQYKSFKNWIDHWRPQTANQYSADYLYLQPNGRPYTVDYLRKMLVPLVKQLWNQYSLYTMRHWCAIARLIKDYIDRETWDKTDIQDWLGHEKVSTTDQYTRYAKKYYLNAPYDWIKAILKYHGNDMVGENGKKSITPLFSGVSTDFTGERMDAPVGIWDSQV